MNPPHPSQNYRTRRRPPLAQNSTWAGSPGWDPAGVRGRRPASGAASGRVRPRSGIRVWQTSNISLGSGMVRRGVRPPSGRIRRGLGTRVLLTCPGPADPRYWGGSCWANRQTALRKALQRRATDSRPSSRAHARQRPKRQPRTAAPSTAALTSGTHTREQRCRPPATPST